jgi:hypothetical protein
LGFFPLSIVAHFNFWANSNLKQFIPFIISIFEKMLIKILLPHSVRSSRLLQTAFMHITAGSTSILNSNHRWIHINAQFASTLNPHHRLIRITAEFPSPPNSHQYSIPINTQFPATLNSHNRLIFITGCSMPCSLRWGTGFQKSTL